jgi:hypothetical protein
MFCPNCGSEVKEGAYFCPKCGATLGKEEITISLSKSEGLWHILLDRSFSNFITSKIIRLIYTIDIILSAGAGIWVLILLIISMHGIKKILGVILGLLGGSFIFFLLVLFFRVVCENMIIFFRVAEDVRKIAQIKDKK